MQLLLIKSGNGKLVGEFSIILCRRHNYLKEIKFVVKEDEDNSDLFNLQEIMLQLSFS